MLSSLQSRLGLFVPVGETNVKAPLLWPGPSSRTTLPSPLFAFSGSRKNSMLYVRNLMIHHHRHLLGRARHVARGIYITFPRVVSMKLPHVSLCSEDRFAAAAACVLRAEGKHASLRPHIWAIRGCVGEGATWPFAAKVRSEVLSFRNSSKHFMSIATPTQLVTRPREDRKCL